MVMRAIIKNEAGEPILSTPLIVAPTPGSLLVHRVQSFNAGDPKYGPETSWLVVSVIHRVERNCSAEGWSHDLEVHVKQPVPL